ncbi:polysaccharide pyruvyl transferase family protein [Brevundimonas sp.]|uniref:polysaccharide pyruvyl transferase family protein n=1 Tax=Brevundimonas sp. TaxID=1871086 RepID=UPI0025DAB2DD|nr:polysaccharide pyruvyl transferase family protein [Brevundimonas sp.]
MQVAIMGTPGGVEDASRYSLHELIQIAGQNTGNFLFQYAVSLLVAGDLRFIGRSGMQYSDPNLHAGLEGMIFPAANHLRRGADWSSLAGFLKTVKAPLGVMGIGAQAADSRPSEAEVVALSSEPEIQALAEAIAAKASLVTVRGAFSAEVARACGIADPLILGCPSLLINPKRDLGQRLAKRIDELKRRDPAQRIKLGLAAAAPFEIRETPKADIERKLFKWLVANDGLYIQQSGGPDAIAFALRDTRHASLGAVRSIWQVLAPDMAFEDFIDYSMRRNRLFWNVEPWFAQMRALDLVAGTRFHGNMFAIAEGVPGVFVAHDSRTQELVETMQTPWVDFTDVEGAESLQDLLQAVRFDPAAFDANRRRIARETTAALRGAGFEPSEHLQSLGADS